LQEKSDLQEEGDRLDEEIRKGEHDIAALEATLKVVDAANRQFVRSLDFIKADGDVKVIQRESFDRDVLFRCRSGNGRVQIHVRFVRRKQIASIADSNRSSSRVEAERQSEGENREMQRADRRDANDPREFDGSIYDCEEGAQRSAGEAIEGHRAA
jgi:hypothetical protein